MTGARRPLAALAMIAMMAAGCSNPPAGTGPADSAAAEQGQAVKFAECMRDNGVKQFPDPDASGRLTIDAVLNGSSLDPNSPAWKKAMDACKNLQPPGFTGHTRSASQQGIALEFAQCMRDNGVKDFPDPTADGPLIDTDRIPSVRGKDPRSIPGFGTAARTCGALYASDLGVTSP